MKTIEVTDAPANDTDCRIDTGVFTMRGLEMVVTGTHRPVATPMRENTEYMTHAWRRVGNSAHVHYSYRESITSHGKLYFKPRLLSLVQ